MYVCMYVYRYLIQCDIKIVIQPKCSMNKIDRVMIILEIGTNN